MLTKHAPRKEETTLFLNENSTSMDAPDSGWMRAIIDCVVEFAVDGNALPDVNFNIGESYAGLLPISDDPNDPNQLFFWFFPSQNPSANDEITICTFYLAVLTRDQADIGSRAEWRTRM